MHQHVFSFEGIRARESFLSAHPPSPSICLSLSLSPVQKGGERRDNSIFFRIQIWEIGRKKGEKRTEGPKFGTLFFFFLFWMNFGTRAFVLLCVKWRRRPSKNMSTMWSLALFAIKTDACSHSLSFKTIHRDALWSAQARTPRPRTINFCCRLPTSCSLCKPDSRCYVPVGEI